MNYAKIDAHLACELKEDREHYLVNVLFYGGWVAGGCKLTKEQIDIYSEMIPEIEYLSLSQQLELHN